MRFKMIALLMTVFSMVAAPMVAHAGSSGLPIRNVYSSSNVTTSAYVQLVASTVQGFKGISVVNSGTNPIEIAFGAAGHEVVQMIVPGAALSPAPVYYPIGGGYGIRVSVIALSGTNSTGELEMNLLYN